VVGVLRSRSNGPRRSLQRAQRPGPIAVRSLRPRPLAPASRAADGPHIVVVAPPIFQRQVGLRERGEQGLVQKIVAQATVETFDEGVLHRLARRNLAPVDPGKIGPAQDGVGLGTVVADDCPGPAARADQKIELTRNPPPLPPNIGEHELHLLDGGRRDAHAPG